MILKVEDKDGWLFIDCVDRARTEQKPDGHMDVHFLLHDGSKDTVHCHNDMVFLLNDSGKTIERLN